MLEIVVPGKWILAGEHAVLRGSPALVFPLKSRYLRLRFQPSEAPLTSDFSGEFGSELQLLFWGVLERACDVQKISRQNLRGHLQIESSLPIGAGLGTSAALCVVVSKWLQSQGLLKEDVYEFSKNLEDLFHGESSGVDIAVALSARPLHFEKSGLRKEFEPHWKPYLYLSYSGKRGVTRECVQLVKNFIEKNPAKGKELDEKMRRSVELAEQALTTNEVQGLPKLKESLNEAAQCFKDWGLFEGAMADQAQKLFQYGALAVKPTGSGDGGYLLSLWDQTPPENLLKDLTSCF